MCRFVPVTCGGGGGGGEVVDVPVDEGQLLDDGSAQSPLLQHAAAMLADGVQSLTPGSEHAVALNEVLTQVHFGAALPEGAAAVRGGAFVIVHTNLRQEAVVTRDTCEESNT